MSNPAVEVATEVKNISHLTHMGKAFDAVRVNPTTIAIEKDFNPRDFSLPQNRAHLDNIKNNIKALGFLDSHPLTVRLDGPPNAKYPVLIDGECRLKAVLELIAEGHDIKTVPVIQKSTGVGTVAERIVVALASNEGLALTQMEVGKSYLKLLGYGWTKEQIMERTGKSERYVREAVAIADAPEEVRQMVASGEVSQQAAIKATRELGEDAAAVLREAVIQNKAEGKTGPVKAPKADKRESKLSVIRDIVEEYNSTEPKDLTREVMLRMLDDITAEFEADSKPAKAAAKKDNKKPAKGKKAA
jgi:hypothetical protein